MSVLTRTRGIVVETGPGAEKLTIDIDKELTPEDVKPTLEAVRNMATPRTRNVSASLAERETLDHCELTSLRTLSNALARAGLTFDIRATSAAEWNLLGLAGIPSWRSASGEDRPGHAEPPDPFHRRTWVDETPDHRSTSGSQRRRTART